MEDARIVVIAKPRSKTPGVTISPRGVIVAVRERPLEGAANEACRRALANAIGIAPSRVTLVRGARSKEKLFRIEGVGRDIVMARLSAHAT
jgi:uncharacterized protein YggU (UPF0235/DUF167 family)